MTSQPSSDGNGVAEQNSSETQSNAADAKRTLLGDPTNGQRPIDAVETPGSLTAVKNHNRTDEDNTGQLPLSVVIITENEEDQIEDCIESVFAACRSVAAFEVILVDSASTDRTVELAKSYPITICRIPEAHTVSCGAGRFVGDHLAVGEMVLHVDGDMTLTEEWLPKAIEFLQTHEETVGVEGCLDEVTEETVRTVDKIGGVTLYDADALASVGGFDPFLLGYEDIDVGFQLTAAGNRLVRLPVVSASHDDDQTINEPLRRLRQGYYVAPGQAIRKWITTPEILWRLLRRQNYKIGLIGWLTAGLLSLRSPRRAAGWLALSVVGFALIVSKRGSRGAVDFLATKLLAIGGVVDGLGQPPRPASEFPLSAVEIVASGEILQGRNHRSDTADSTTTAAEDGDWTAADSADDTEPV